MKEQRDLVQGLLRKAESEPLTPYAVELRYDHDFWPSGDTADEARHAALAVKRFVLERLPTEWTTGRV